MRLILISVISRVHALFFKKPVFIAKTGRHWLARQGSTPRAGNLLVPPLEDIYPHAMLMTYVALASIQPLQSNPARKADLCTHGTPAQHAHQQQRYH